MVLQLSKNTLLYYTGPWWTRVDGYAGTVECLRCTSVGTRYGFLYVKNKKVSDIEGNGNL